MLQYERSQFRCGRGAGIGRGLDQGEVMRGKFVDMGGTQEDRRARVLDWKRFRTCKSFRQVAEDRIETRQPPLPIEPKETA